jgi:purine-cytosine permease-like protein
MNTITQHLGNIMNYKRTQSKNSSLRGEKWTWLKIVSFILLMLLVAIFGPDLLKLLNNY